MNNLQDFIDYYSSLSEGEKFEVAREFNEKTKGRISAYNNPIPVAVALIEIENEGETYLL